MNWSKEEVCSLLCAKVEDGCTNLNIEYVKPLFDAGFNGTSIGNIISDLLKIKTNDENVSFLEKWNQLIKYKQMDFPNASLDDFTRNKRATFTIGFSIKKIAEQSLANYETGNPTKQNVFFTIVSGGLGSGKSRLLFEMKRIIKGLEGEHPEFKRTELLYFKVNGYSLDTATDPDKLPISLICSGLVFANHLQ
ncbi:hypothetical protein ABK040_000794 [Willaertia magna]